MKYFEIQQETDSKIIGKYPQVKELKIEFHKARASQWGIIRSWQTDDDIPDLDNFVLHHNSKLSDCVSNNYVTSLSGLFLSEKCHQIFKSFQINGNFYPMTIFRRGIPHSYRFLWYEMGGKRQLDWDNSTFEEFNKETHEFGPVVCVKDHEDYKVKFRHIRTTKGDEWDLVEKKLVFKNYFDITPAFGIGLICNEKVKNAIEESQLTGFQFRPVTVEIVFENAEKL